MDENSKSRVNKREICASIDLYQIQIEGLRKGWLIYPKTLNPLSLTVKRRKQRPSPLRVLR